MITVPSRWLTRVLLRMIIGQPGFTSSEGLPVVTPTSSGGKAFSLPPLMHARYAKTIRTKLLGQRYKPPDEFVETHASKAYHMHTSKWKEYANQNTISQKNQSVTHLRQYLAEMFQSDSDYRAINTTRSSLPAFSQLTISFFFVDDTQTSKFNSTK